MIYITDKTQENSMRLVIQRVSEASVSISNNKVSEIKQGLLILLGIGKTDGEEDILYLVRKVASMRIFSDDEGKMNWSIQDIKGEVILVSQFTLFAQTRKGNRPSYIDAAPPEMAIPLYEKFITELKSSLGESKVQTGSFGADMQVSLVNDGPVTICIDSKEK